MATTTFAYSALDDPPQLSPSSNSLEVPTEPMANRRLSDSVLRSRQARMTRDGESELVKLRQWAAEAMTARPHTNNQPPLDEEGGSPMQRRESEGSSWQYRSPAQINSYHHNTVPRHRLSYDRSTSPEPSSPDVGWSLMDGFRSRPSSMFTSSPARPQALQPSQPLPSSSIAPPTGSTTAAPPGREPQWRGEEGEELGAKISSPLAKTPKSVSNGRSDGERCSISPCSSFSRNSVAPLRLSYSTSYSKGPSAEQRTPRARSSNAGLSSPTWTSSTCESEDDGAGLMTPLDENGPRPSQGGSASMRQSYTGDTPPLNSLGDGVADRVGVSRGLDSLGSTADETMRSMTGVDLATRRGSLTGSRPCKGSFKVFSAAPPSTDRATHRFESPPSAPLLNRSTLLDLGLVNGITPPASRGQGGPASSLCYSSSVVSTGLEMGLGVSMAASALSTNLPNSSSSGIKTITEPRFPRSLGMDFGLNLKMTESEIPMHAVPAPAHYTPEVVSDRAAEEVSFADLDREDSELARRRTTGNMLVNKREAGTVGKRRHIRAGTHDPRASGPSNVGNTGSSGHRLTSSVSTFPGLTEEEPGLMAERGAKTHALPRLDVYSNMGSSTSSSSVSDAVASGGHGSTPVGTPLQTHKAMLSPGPNVDLDRSSYLSSRADGGGFDRRSVLALDRGEGAKPSHVGGAAVNGGLMGMGGGGHFGPGVRAKIGEVLADLIHGVPLGSAEEETIQLVEYGCLNSRSAQLMQPIISAFIDQSHAVSLPSSTPVDASYFDTHTKPDPSLLSFQVTHEDSSTADFRPLTQLLDSHPESYLDPHWQSSHSPSLTNSVFSTFAARPFASRIAPPHTFHAGISLMDLHWTHTPCNPSVSASTTAQAELTTFLSARGQEFKQDGVLIMAYIARSEEVTPLGSLDHKDIWTTLSNTLAPCIQRLVSCSMVKSDVARHLLNLPIHPRSAKQTKAVLKSVRQTWKVEWSCGLGEEEEEGEEGEKARAEEGAKPLVSEPLPLRLPHPAWKAYNSGTLSRIAFTEHMIQLFKNLYESHFRTVLREKGKLSKGAVEFVLDSLWDVLFSRIVDRHPDPMKDVEIEVSIVALRRR